MQNKDVQLSFDLDDKTEKSVSEFLSGLDIIRRTVFVASLFKQYYKGEDVSKLEERLLDIIDNLTKGQPVGKSSELNIKNSQTVSSILKTDNSATLLPKSVDNLNLMLDKISDEGFD